MIMKFNKMISLHDYFAKTVCQFWQHIVSNRPTVGKPANSPLNALVQSFYAI